MDIMFTKTCISIGQKRDTTMCHIGNNLVITKRALTSLIKAHSPKFPIKTTQSFYEMVKKTPYEGLKNIKGVSHDTATLIYTWASEQNKNLYLKTEEKKELTEVIATEKNESTQVVDTGPLALGLFACVSLLVNKKINMDELEALFTAIECIKR